MFVRTQLDASNGKSPPPGGEAADAGSRSQGAPVGGMSTAGAAPPAAAPVRAGSARAALERARRARPGATAANVVARSATLLSGPATPVEDAPLGAEWFTVPGDRRGTLLVRILATLAIGSILTYFVSLVVSSNPTGPADPWQIVTGTLGGLAVVALSVLRVRRFRDARASWGWVVFAGAINLWGSQLFLVLDAAGHGAVTTGRSHVFTVPSAIALLVAVVLLTQRGLGRVLLGTRLDGITAGLGAAALILAVIAPSLDWGGGLADTLLTLVYPMIDVAVIGLFVAGLAPRGYRTTWSTALVGVGVAVVVCGDVLHVVTREDRALFRGSWLDATWLVGLVFFAAAAWAPARHRRMVASTSKGDVLRVPAGIALATLGLIMVMPVVDISSLAVVPAVATVGVALTRTLLTAADLRRLHASHEQARTDELTRLPNRRAFFEQLDRRLAAPLVNHAVFVIDLDGFKGVNDTYGHQAGDELLQHVSERLRQRLPDHVALARMGGDEFAAVAPISGAAEATDIANRITFELAQPFALSTTTVRIGGSCGVALQPQHGRARAELLRTADLAMYEAKRHRTGVAVYDPGHDPNHRDRLQLVEELRDAVAHRRLELHYQPVVSLVDRSLQGVEALVRWNHPRLGLMLAEDFLPLVEQAELSRELTNAVIEQAVSFVSHLYHQYGIALTVSINLSARDLDDDRLGATLMAMLDACRVPTHLLGLELPESALVTAPERASRLLTEARTLGLRVAIDDLGNGPLPLSLLPRMPVEEFKLHRSLAETAPGDAGAAAVVEAIGHLAASLGIVLTAVGVEHAATAAHLATLGCRQAQGRAIGSPLDGATLLAQLARMRASGPIGVAAQQGAPPAQARPVPTPVAQHPDAVPYLPNGRPVPPSPFDPIGMTGRNGTLPTAVTLPRR